MMNNTPGETPLNNCIADPDDVFEPEVQEHIKITIIDDITNESCTIVNTRG